VEGSLSDRYTKYWHEGLAARERAEPESICPYEYGTVESFRWRLGWSQNRYPVVHFYNGVPTVVHDAPEHMSEEWARQHREKSWR